MKKIITLLLALGLALGMTGCSFSIGTESPTDVADKYLKAIKASDKEVMQELYSGGDMNLVDDVKKSASTSSFDEALAKDLAEKILGFEYTLSNEKIDDDKATVDVSIKTYNLGKAFSDFLTDYMAEAFTLALSGADEKKIEALAMEVFGKKVKEMKFDYEKTVPLSLTKKDGKWVVDEIKEDGEFYNALLGGMMDALKDFTDSWGGE